MSKINSIRAIQVLDSRGVPTVATKISLENGISASAMVPSGASTGSKEALELRDGGTAYSGKSVENAVSNVNTVIAQALKGFDVNNQSDIDHKMIEIDATSDKSNLGANAILSVSLASAHLAANYQEKNLHDYFNKSFNEITGLNIDQSLPMPMLNILNGGEHADNNIDIQEFMIIPKGSSSIKQALQWSSEIYWKLKEILKDKGLSTSVGDEGGFAPNLKSNEEAIQFILTAIEACKLKPGEDISLALDCAASEFYKDGKYNLSGESRTLDNVEFTNYLSELIQKYPIISIEDGMDEMDYSGWNNLTKQIGKDCQLVGDDLFVTNKKILKEGISKGLANSILIKFNQIGTLTETYETIKVADENNYKSIISHRSGETEDTTLSDLAVGLGSGQIKTGAPCRSDRVAKYNRLLWIENSCPDIKIG
ncbi:MAG: phosphopyruvate hydratase [SAR86 cluster bacterium]|jgi:enolase|uniref:Enolase n=1 Tax=SAR86 cluster bacterium TaxID=2030880 RepID=A0A520MCB3_9GAMM|nr:MAG: phosphopyruvate hydratase [SAR86 cluster bacterium]